MLQRQRLASDASDGRAHVIPGLIYADDAPVIHSAFPRSCANTIICVVPTSLGRHVYARNLEEHVSPSSPVGAPLPTAIVFRHTIVKWLCDGHRLIGRIIPRHRLSGSPQ